MSIHENARSRKPQQDAHRIFTADDNGTFQDVIARAMSESDGGRTIKLDIAFIFAALARLPLDDRGVVMTEIMKAAENVSSLSGAERALLTLFVYRCPPLVDDSAPEVSHDR